MNGNVLQHMHSVLRDFQPRLDDVRDQRRRTASRFNVAEAFGVSHTESAHSEILAYLLDPSKHHDQGDIFLKSFLKFLRRSFQPASVQGADVKREADIKPYGRVDILIRLANGQFILIENKVMAQEAPCQIGGYQKWLKRQGEPAACPHQIVFLTPEGRRPESTCKPEEVICLSYVQVADWIASIRKQIEAQQLGVMLEQYADSCHQIGGTLRRDAMPDAIRQFFLDRSDPARLEAALELETFLADFKKESLETFCRNVGKEITEKLQANGYHTYWIVEFDRDFLDGIRFRNWKGWRIEWRDRQAPRRYAVKVEFVPSKGLSFGITRGRNLPCKEDQDSKEKALQEMLKKRGFDPKDTYVGLKSFHSIHSLGLPQFDLSQNNDVLELLREMQDSNRPLTHQVADLVWGLFCNFRQELEALNRN